VVTHQKQKLLLIRLQKKPLLLLLLKHQPLTLLLLKHQLKQLQQQKLLMQHQLFSN
jgi:hypothetical protein